MRKRFCAFITAAALLTSLLSASYEALDFFNYGESMTVSELVSVAGVEIDDSDIIRVLSCDSDSLESGESAYIEIESENNQGGTTKTLIIPYSGSGDGYEIAEIELTNGSSATTRGTSGYVTMSFKKINIVITVMASYNGYPSSGMSPVGITAKWNVISDDDTENTVTSMTADYSVYGALVYADDTSTIVNDDYQYNCTFTQSNPTKNIYYGASKSISDSYLLVLNGSPGYGQSVVVTITVNDKQYEDGFAM